MYTIEKNILMIFILIKIYFIKVRYNFLYLACNMYFTSNDQLLKHHIIIIKK